MKVLKTTMHLTFKSRWTTLLWWSRCTPSNICLIRRVIWPSGSSSSDTQWSNISPPAALTQRQNVFFTPNSTTIPWHTHQRCKEDVSNTTLTIPAKERGHDRSRIQRAGSPREGCSLQPLKRRSREWSQLCSHDLVSASWWTLQQRLSPWPFPHTSSPLQISPWWRQTQN